MINEIVIYVILFGVGIWALLCLANSGIQNYCRCIQEPRREDDDLYPDLYSECKDNVPEVKRK